jgi:hypothetical protein
MIEDEAEYAIRHAHVEDTGRALAKYIASDDNPERFRVRRMAFTIKVGLMESEFDEANTGAAVSGSSFVQEVRRGTLLAWNDLYRGTVDEYMEEEATINEAVGDITTAVANHPGFKEEIMQSEKVLGVLHQAAQTVYSRPTPKVPPATS